jgi:DNA-binding transcriptional ArsR family regulator
MSIHLSTDNGTANGTGGGIAASTYPDYDLPDTVLADRPEQLKALGDRTRLTILDLVLERAATVSELAAALSRPKSTVAHHVEVLERAGLLRVVRTRKVRAVTEAFYGRTGRTVHAVEVGGDHPMGSMLAESLAEQIPPRPDDGGGFTMRHARISAERANEFAERVTELALEFTRLPREGEVVYGFIAGVYPTEREMLPPRETPEPAPKVTPAHKPKEKRR